ncbi:MAG: PfkB family carbohydrate kinase [Actinomycetia bacterium]|nr:PfkB family carbohydrate kinase [Actinomycetes bacterium]
MSELDLLVVGDVNPDVIVTALGVQPEFGQVEQLVDSASLVMGGSAAITAAGAARLGLRVGLCGVVGDDDLGQLMMVRLTETGVDLRHLRVDAYTPTGMSVILNRGDDRAVLTASGTISALSPDDLDALPDRPARHVHAASYYLMSDAFRDVLPAAFGRFRSAGATTSLDTNWDPHERWDLSALLAETDVFLPNEAELTAIGRSPILDRAIEVVSENGCDVAVKRGPQGAVAQIAGQRLRVLRTPPVDFVDAVGAGDSFDAGFLTGRLLGRDPGQCLAMAVIAGTLSTASTGGTDSQPTADEVELWMSSVKVDDLGGGPA